MAISLRFCWLTLTAVVISGVALFARADDCSSLWEYDLNAGPIGPKSFMGDTNAVYAAYAFKSEPTTALRLSGKFPRARFLSIESYRTKKNHAYDALFDRQIEPDIGSENPFRNGVDINTDKRDYTVWLVPDGAEWSGVNAMKLAIDSSVSSVWIRYYSPNANVSVAPADLPRVEAIDVRDGSSARCPEPYKLKYETNYPEILTVVVPEKTTFAFQQKNINLAGNSAIPGTPTVLRK